MTLVIQTLNSNPIICQCLYLNHSKHIIQRSDSQLSLASPIDILNSRRWQISKTRNVYGQTRAMTVLSTSDADYIFITSDSGYLSVLDCELNSLYNWTLDVPGLSMTTLGHGLCIDPTGTYICTHALAENIKILQIDSSNNSCLTIVNSISLVEYGLIYNAEFIYSSNLTLYLALTVVQVDELHIVLYEKENNLTLQQVSCTGSILLGKGLIPLHLLALPSIPESFLVITNDGCFVLSVSQLQSKNVKKERVELPGPFHTREIPEKLESIVSDVVAVGSLESNLRKQRLYLSTDSGNIVHVVIDSHLQMSFQHVSIQPKPILSMTFLEKVGNQDLMILFGDLCQGQVALIDAFDATTLVSIPNTSPCVDGLYLSCMNSLCLANGQFDGQLSLVKKGYETFTFADLNLSFQGVNGIWNSSNLKNSIRIIVSFTMSSRILELNSLGEWEDASEESGLVVNQPTLYSGLFKEDFTCQITPYCVCTTDKRVWNSPSKIILGDCFLDSVALVLNLNGNTLKLLTASRDSKTFQETFSIPLNCEPSCLLLRQKHCFIGTFDSVLKIFDIPSLDCLLDVDLNPCGSGSNIPDSIHYIESDLYMIGFRNGNLATLVFDLPSSESHASNLFKCRNLEFQCLGTFPLSIIRIDPSCWFAFSDCFWILELDKLKKLTITPVHIDNDDSNEKIFYATPIFIHELEIQRSIITVTSTNEFKFISLDSSLDSKKSIARKSIPIKDKPRRVLYDSNNKMLLVATLKRNGSDLYSDLLIVDPKTTKSHHKWSLSQGELVQCMTMWHIKHDTKPDKRYICIGTSHYTDPSTNKKGGRVMILILKLKEGLYRIKKVGELFLPDSISCIKSFMASNLLVSAGYYVYKLKIEAQQRNLVISDTIEMRWDVTALDTFPIPEGALIAIASQKESISIYKYILTSRKFEFLASDRVSRLPTCLLFIQRDLILAGDRFGDIFGLELPLGIEDGMSIDQSLETSHYINFGEPIVALLTGDLCVDPIMPRELLTLDSLQVCKELENSIFKRSRSFIKTWDESSIHAMSHTIHAISITGSIYSITQLNQQYHQESIVVLLQDLQSAMNHFPATAPILGHLHSEYTHVKNIIDLDFLSNFLCLNLQDQSLLLKLANISLLPNQISCLLECLK